MGNDEIPWTCCHSRIYIYWVENPAKYPKPFNKQEKTTIYYEQDEEKERLPSQGKGEVY